MYNEVIFEKLKNIYTQIYDKRKDELVLTEERAINLLRSKYNIYDPKQLSKVIEANINKLIYFDSKIKRTDNSGSIDNNKINDYQAMIDRTNNKCFCNFDLKVLSRHFSLLSQICEKNIKYTNVLQNLTAHICNGDYFNIGIDDLSLFFDYAIDLYLLKGDIHIEKANCKVITAIETFNLQHNTDYEIKMSYITLKNKTHKKIHNIIENKIIKLGGFKTCQLIFNKYLNQRYNKQFDRYLIYRDRTILGDSPTPIPYQYLLHIACKHLSKYNISQISSQDLYQFQKIINLSIAYIDLLEIFNENPWGEIKASIDSIPYLIKSNILLECLCFPVQYAPNFVKDILRNLYVPFGKTVAKLPDIYNFKSLYDFINKIFQLPPCSIISPKILSNNLHISLKIIRHYLDYFSLEADYINNDYNEAFKENNLYDKPFIKIDKEHYFLLCPQLCGYSFLKILYNDMYRTYNGNNKQHLSNKFGKALEKYIYHLLDTYNYTYKTGVYAPKTHDRGECDLILETNTKTVFVELKNSGIAKEFELGNDRKVLNQLGKTSLLAEKQILKHKLYLIKNDQKCNLYTSENADKPLYQIKTINKKLYSIALCGAEALFFTSGHISKLLISSLPYITFQVKGEDNNELKDINKVANDVRSLVEEYAKNQPAITIQDIFYGSTVKSIQEFWIALKNSTTKEEFINNLIHDTWMQNYSGDFYINLKQYLELANYKSNKA